MPRVRLSEQGAKNRRTSSGGVFNSSSTNEFGINDGLDDFSDFTYDEFEFDAQPHPSSTGNAVTTSKTSQETINEKKKSSTKSSSKSSYPKLFNSSKDKNTENDESVPNNMERENMGDKRPRVSFDSETKSTVKKKAGGGKKKDSSKTGKKAKKTKEPRSFLSDEDLYDTDSDEELLVQSISKVAKNRVSIETDGDEPINAVTKSTKKRTTKSTSKDLSGTSEEMTKATTSTKKNPAKSTKCKTIKEGPKEASRTRIKSSPQISTLVTVLPYRALGIDNRALPTIYGDSMTTSFLVRMGGFIEGALDKGLLTSPSSDVVAGGATDGQTVMVSLTPGGNSVAVKTCYLFDGVRGSNTREKSSWLSDILTPINCGFVSNEFEDGVSFDYGDESMDVDCAEKKDRKIEGFAASDSWGYFADMGELNSANVG